MKLKTISRLLIFAIVFALGTSVVSARPDKAADKKKALTELRQYKKDFLIKELDITKDQQNAFFPLYEKMDDQLRQIADETRDLEKKISKESSEAECEAAALVIFTQHQREGAVEMEYFEKFKKILAPYQLVKLKKAERKFTRKLVDHHRKSK